MKSPCYADIFKILAIIVFLTVIFQYRMQDATSLISKIVWKNFASNPMKLGSKWIVVTTIQQPTEDIRNLACQFGWQMVVVAETETPKDWYYPGVHFLSLRKQKELFGDFIEELPYKNYTRKNLGYLYAIMNGAEWIYDTDDDSKSYGLGLSQFDYEITSPISGLRYISKSDNISEKLFNPYRFYGYIWPSGFPLEYIAGHTNGKDRMISCRQMNSPVVQQGIVMIDPDVYRPLHAEKGGGMNVSFNTIAPPITLDSGTYAPWNSQNILFHYKSFFIMNLPTTVEYRLSDIWRSYFGQKLLHLIGENVAFYPTNAIQIRNTHDYLSDFYQEKDVYEQSAKIVEFLDSWKCSYNDIVNCALQLADGFVEHNFFNKKDRKLIGAWFKQLTRLGYIFPQLFYATGPIPLGGKLSNCRTANLDLEVDSYGSKKDKELSWATQTVRGFGEILNWCSQATGNNDTFLPTAEEFLHYYKNHTGLKQKKDTVLVLICNQPWRPAIIGLLQRLYSPFFKTTIFCGTWTDPSVDPGLLPPIPPFNFVNISAEEMRGGASYGYCVPKIKELQLQNVTGYYFVADDTVFNIWHKLPLDKFLNPEKIDDEKYWWKPEEILRSYDAFENHYRNDPRFGKTWLEYKNNLQRTYPGKNITHHYLNEVKKTIADFIYIPSHTMEYIANFMEVMMEAEVFVEVAFGKVMDGLDYNRGGPFNYLWWGARLDQWSPYNSSIIGLHPMKLGEAHVNLDYRKKYCNTVIKAFNEEIYARNG